MRRYPAQLVAVILVGLVVWSYIHFRDYRPIGTDSRLIRPPGILLEVEDIKLAGRSAGKPVWRMDARRLTVSQNRLMTTLEGIHGGTIYEDGKPAASVEAGRASYDSIRRSLDASGGVSISARDGTAFRTSRLSYDGAAGRITCPANVNIKRKESGGTAEGLVADLRHGVVHGRNLRLKVMTKDVPITE